MTKDMERQGQTVYSLCVGEPDYQPPAEVLEATAAAARSGNTKYTAVNGEIGLRIAIAKDLSERKQTSYTPEQIVVSTGAKQSIANTVLAIVDKGDEVIIPTPFWVTYSEIVKLAGGKPVLVRTKIENGYKITPQELEAHISVRTKLFMFSSPCNPSGALYNKSELESLVHVFEKHPDIYIMSDEIYEYINYEGKHESIAQFESVKDRTIVINGLSKGYAMTGWRVGYIAAPLDVAKACDKLQGQFTSATNSIAQRAAIVALTSDLKPTLDMVESFKMRRAKVMQLLSEIPGVICSEPPGAFYVFPNVKFYFGKKTPEGDVISNADELCMYLLNTAHVSSVTGSAFGEPDCIRLSFANSIENIEKGFAKLKMALLSLS
jgi:aspartate aminotransferase